jgi:hypothetical protein
MPPRAPFKKDLTAIGRGGISKHTGKGAREQSRGFDGAESLTGGDSYGRMANRYPKPSLDDLAGPSPMGAAPAPAASMPTALMPGGGGDEEA